MTVARTASIALALGISAAAYAQQGPSPIPADSPAAIENARNSPPLEGTNPNRVPGASRGPRLDVTTREVPNVRTPPPSNDRFHNPRTRTGSQWTTEQRGTSATGMWPMPGTGGQPGTMQ